MRSRISLWFRLVLCASLLLASRTVPVRAASIAVTVTSDDLTVNGNCTLREAIKAANTDTAVDACPAGSGADVITLPAGTYTITIPGIFEDLNQTGDLDVNSSLTLQGSGQDSTTIQVNRDLVVDRILDLTAPGSTVTISGITFRDGNLTMESGPGGAFEYPMGGAIYNAGTLNISHSAFMSNTADATAAGDGGGIYNGGTLNASTLYFEGNYASYGGGSIHNDGLMTLDEIVFYRNEGYGSGGVENGKEGDATITSSQFIENRIGLAGGGAISNFGSMSVSDTVFDDNQGDSGTVLNNGTLIMDQVTFTRNDGGSQGVIENHNASLTITRSAFVDNQSNLSGAIFLGQTTQATISETIFEGNTGNQRGGAIMLREGANLTLENSTIRENQSYEGGGIYNDGGVVEIRDSTISGNTGQAGGGGIYNLGQIALENSTISGNEGSPGGGLLQVNGTTTFDFVTITANRFGGVNAPGGTLDFHGSILAGNSAVVNPDCSAVADDTITSRGGNVIGNATGCAWPQDAGDKVGFSFEPVNAMLGPLADNGGPTFTHALLADSPAIDAAGTTNCPAADQRGVERPVGDACDSGAYEGSAAQTLEHKIFIPQIGKGQ